MSSKGSGKQMTYNSRTRIYTGFGLVLKQEENNKPFSAPLVWVLRDEESEKEIDRDESRFELANRNELLLIGKYAP